MPTYTGTLAPSTVTASGLISSTASSGLNQFAAKIQTTVAAPTTSTATGALAVAGGVGVAGNLNVGGFISGTITNLNAGTYVTAGSVTGNWTLTSGSRWNATYADLAERFESDSVYEPGTVVEIGGPAEITAVAADLSEEVFGVISTNAAYLMNSGAGSDATHPPVAVQGRVPVRVTGKIHKGDRLVSAGNGLARAGRRSEITAWNVIGRALEDKTTDGEGTIEAVVKLNS